MLLKKPRTNTTAPTSIHCVSLEGLVEFISFSDEQLRAINSLIIKDVNLSLELRKKIEFEPTDLCYEVINPASPDNELIILDLERRFVDYNILSLFSAFSVTLSRCTNLQELEINNCSLHQFTQCLWCNNITSPLSALCTDLNSSVRNTGKNIPLKVLRYVNDSLAHMRLDDWNDLPEELAYLSSLEELDFSNTAIFEDNGKRSNLTLWATIIEAFYTLERNTALNKLTLNGTFIEAAIVRCRSRAIRQCLEPSNIDTEQPPIQESHQTPKKVHFSAAIPETPEQAKEDEIIPWFKRLPKDFEDWKIRKQKKFLLENLIFASQYTRADILPEEDDEDDDNDDEIDEQENAFSTEDQQAIPTKNAALLQAVGHFYRLQQYILRDDRQRIFVLRKIAGDGNCGFTALGIRREELIALLKKKISENPLFYQRFKDVLREANNTIIQYWLQLTLLQTEADDLKQVKEIYLNLEDSKSVAEMEVRLSEKQAEIQVLEQQLDTESFLAFNQHIEALEKDRVWIDIESIRVWAEHAKWHVHIYYPSIGNANQICYAPTPSCLESTFIVEKEIHLLFNGIHFDVLIPQETLLKEQENLQTSSARDTNHDNSECSFSIFH